MTADKTETTNKEKLAEALALVNEAARGSKDELLTAIGDKYNHMKDVIMEKESKVAQWSAETKRKAADTLSHARDVSVEKTKEVASAVDESVHNNPWPYVGGAAVAGLLLGYILGKKS